MIAIILVIVFGIFFSFFATKNSAPVSLNLGGHIINPVPLYLVILISIAIGVAVVGFIYLVRILSDKLTLSKKKSELKNTKEEVTDLNKQVHKLELENIKLKTQLGEADDENSI
ncbi:hypothetical protein BH10PAT1_BH10PAT1_5930 [soil metagenome]